MQRTSTRVRVQTAYRLLGATPSPDRPTSPAPSPMSFSEIPHLLKYNITTTDGGVILSIWEPAPKNEVRVKPFLYMVRYRLASEAEARKLLAQYLSIYKTMAQATQGKYR